jgi:hypothetical protein
MIIKHLSLVLKVRSISVLLENVRGIFCKRTTSFGGFLPKIIIETRNFSNVAELQICSCVSQSRDVAPRIGPNITSDIKSFCNVVTYSVQ